jgi:gliding motility-associated-like protein
MDTFVTISSPPDILMSAVKTDLLCFNDADGSIDFSVSGGVPNYSFLWSNSEVTEDVNNLSGGYYTVTLTDHNACVKDTTIFIYEPLELDIRGVSTPDYCNQNIGSISLNMSGGETPYTYNWTPTLPNASLVNNLSSGIYNIQVIDSNLCVKDTSIVIQNIPPPVALFTYNDVCEDSLIAIIGDAPGSNIASWSWDLGDGRTSSGQSLSTTYPQNGTYNISMEVVDVNNCTTTVQNPINIYPNPVVSFIPDTVWGCEELEVSFQDFSQADSGSQYIWEFEDHGTSSQQSPIVTFSGAGQYGVGLTVSSPYGCVASTYTYNLIEIYSDPIADFDFMPQDLGILDPLAEFTDLSTDPFTWMWTFGDGGSSTVQHPQYSYSDTGSYNVKLIVTTENSCVASIDKWIIVKPDYILHVPNAFTPNGDFLNDVFLPLGVFHGIGEYTFRIFNRWGEQILENYDVNEGWNGGYYNDLSKMSPDGAYVYVISVRDLHGAKNEFKGTVVLLK